MANGIKKKVFTFLMYVLSLRKIEMYYCYCDALGWSSCFVINIVKTYFSTKRLTIDFFVRGGGGR